MTVQARNAPAVEFRGIAKSFGQLQANTDVSLKVRSGSIHAIVGENGAGKSTAMKILYGIFPPDRGEIAVRGVTRRWRSPSDAISAGIGMIHQHFMLAAPYSSIDNIMIGSEEKQGERDSPRLWNPEKWIPKFLRPLKRGLVRQKLEAISAQHGLSVNWDLPIENLPVGFQQRVEIMKLLYHEAEILILDEPTAVLTPQEARNLFGNLRKLRAQGKAILIITHKLKEVVDLADQVTVLRGGRVVGDLAVNETSVEELADLMVGRKVNLKASPPPPPELGPPMLDVRGLTAGQVLSDLNFEICGGEVVGVAGVEGNGQSELLDLLFHPRDYRAQGTIRVLGRTVLGEGPSLRSRQIRDMEVGWIPGDRHREAVLLGRSIEENFLLGQERRFSCRGFLSKKNLKEETLAALIQYDVKPRSPETTLNRLSGGNQQKLVIAREFAQSPKLLVAAQPTRGVDVGAIEFIHGKILEARRKGAGVLLVSSELDEILALSDRILVMYAGRIVARFKRGEADEQKLGLYMGGAKSG